MANLRIVPVNAADSATLAASPALVSTMAEANLQLIARDRVARSTSLATQTITGTWGGSLKAVNAWGFFRANLVGAQVRLQLYSDTALTTQLYDSTTLDVYTSGPTWGNFNWGEVPWFTAANDPLAAEAPYFKFLSATYYPAGFKLTISNPGGMSTTYFELCRLWLGEYTEAPYNPNYGMQIQWQSATRRTRTHGGSQRPSRGERWRAMKVDLVQATEADRALWMDLQARLDMSQPMVVSVFPNVGGRQERDNCFEGTFADLAPNVRENVSLFTQTFSIEET